MGDAFNILNAGGIEVLGGATLIDPGATPGDVLTIQSDGSVAAESGGGSSPGTEQWNGYSFTYAKAGLTNGVAMFTPSVNELVVDAFVVVTEAFDGTTPTLDIGTFNGTTHGMFALGATTIDMTTADEAEEGAGWLVGQRISDLHTSDAAYAATSNAIVAVESTPSNVAPAIANPLGPNGQRIVPARFSAANPVLVVVSQDGTAGGADPGATQGAAIVFVKTASAPTVTAL